MDKTILVIGATGMLGEPVARCLKEDGFRVRVMTRDTNKARKMFDESFEIVIGDIMDKNSLEKQLDGCFGVHVNLSGELEQLGTENVSSVSSRKGLERITYISGTSVCEDNTWFPLVKQKSLAEKSIHESGVPYSIFCPTWFMETLPKCVRGNRAYMFGKHPDPYHWVAADDYARMVSTSYKSDKAVGKRLFIHGPEAIPFHEALRRYCAEIHSEVKKISTMPYWLVKVIATIRGSQEMKDAGEFMAYFEKVGEMGDPTEANHLLGAPRIVLDEWLEQRKAKSAEG